MDLFVAFFRALTGTYQWFSNKAVEYSNLPLIHMRLQAPMLSKVILIVRRNPNHITNSPGTTQDNRALRWDISASCRQRCKLCD